MFKIFTFSRKMFRFSSAKISDDLSPHIPCLSTFPSVSRKLLFPPYFSKFLPSVSEKFTCILHTVCVFRFPPYFDHDAFIHHPMHVLDAPAIRLRKNNFDGRRRRAYRTSGASIEVKYNITDTVSLIIC